MEPNNMSASKNIKVVFRAYDQLQQELVFPGSHQLSDVANYLRNICNTYIIVDMVPTSKLPTI
tara:strand:+ start:87 stop:275 length:189 start_codon:yes stop_codon:yes gene_type:complete